MILMAGVDGYLIILLLCVAQKDYLLSFGFPNICILYLRDCSQCVFGICNVIVNLS